MLIKAQTNEVKFSLKLIKFLASIVQTSTHITLLEKNIKYILETSNLGHVISMVIEYTGNKIFKKSFT